MAEYKLIRLHFKNTRHTNVMYANKFLDKWVDRVCQCANMTLTRKSDLTFAPYYAIFNEGTLGLIFNSNDYPYFGTRASNSGDTSLSGVQALMGDFACNTYTYQYYPFEADCNLIVDNDNNLVMGTPMISKWEPAYATYGFLFTNGGLMNTMAGNNYNRIYSIGASPAVIALTEPYNSTYNFISNYKCHDDDGENSIIMSDDFIIDSNNKIIGIRDHVKVLLAPALIRTYSTGGFETIVVDDTLYLHIGTGVTWLPISSIEDETIEVTA